MHKFLYWLISTNFLFHCHILGPKFFYTLSFPLVTKNLNILYKGYEHTFVISERQEVIIDLTLATDKIGDLVTNWHVSHEISK